MIQQVFKLLHLQALQVYVCLALAVVVAVCVPDSCTAAGGAPGSCGSGAHAEAATASLEPYESVAGETKAVVGEETAAGEDMVRLLRIPSGRKRLRCGCAGLTKAQEEKCSHRSCRCELAAAFGRTATLPI